MKFEIETLYQLRDTSLDKSLLIEVCKDICKDMLVVIQSQISDASTSRFNVLQAKHLIEDALEAFDDNTGLALGELFGKKENRFKNDVKSARDVSNFFANVLNLPNALDNSEVAILASKDRLVEKALDREIQRFLEIYAKNKTTIANVDKVIEAAKTTSPITKELLEDLCVQTSLKSAIPILAIFKSVENGHSDLFQKKFTKNVVGIPLSGALNGNCDLKKIRKAKREPLDVSRIVLASKDQLLICKPKTSSFVAVPEPLAKLVANVPGVDVADDRAVIFCADPERKIGTLLYVRLQGPPTRIASFDLDCDSEETFNQISSERDTQGNILLTWGLHEEGLPKWVHHACVLESSLLEEGHARKYASGEKMAFEDFGDPDERLSSDLSTVRFDFRDHGNTLTAVNEVPNKCTIACANQIIGELPFNVNAIQGYPLAFTVVKDGNEIVQQRTIHGELVVQDTIQMNHVSYEISGVCVV